MGWGYFHTETKKKGAICMFVSLTFRIPAGFFFGEPGGRGMFSHRELLR